MPDRPLFTIIIPTLNAGKTVGRAVSSALDQAFTALEVIVIDGQSSDDTLRVVQQMKSRDARVSLISDRDSGVFDAMNKGIENAKGDWLLFLGADDYLIDEKILTTISHIFRTHPKTKFVYGDVVMSSGKVQRYPNYSFLKLVEKSICHQAIVYHRSLFDSGGYDPKYKVCADWDFNLKVFRKENHPVYVGQPLAYFSLNGISRNWRQNPEYLRHFADKEKVIKRYCSGVAALYYLGRYRLGMTARKIKPFR